MANPNPTHKFKKGVVTNPNGRPKKGTSLTDLLEKHLDKEEFVKEVIRLAKEEGRESLIKYIIDRIDGKITEKHEVSTPESRKFNVKITKDE